MTVLRLGTRKSALALAQSTLVADAIRTATGRDVELVHVTTAGDVSAASLVSIGGTGVFVSALRDALLMGQIDVAVHSLKGHRPYRHRDCRRRPRDERQDSFGGVGGTDKRTEGLV